MTPPDAGPGSVPAITLNDGHSIPQLGFGVFQIPPADTEAATAAALDIGYRHIDTAEMYGNEQGVGRAVARSGLDRAEVFVTSKLNNGFHRPDDARRAFDRTLAELGFDYVDLFLIHWPLPTLYDGDFVSTWKALIEFHGDGRARSIGVSNFQPHHLDRLRDETEVVPAVNQIEVHPYLTQDGRAGYDAAHGSPPRRGPRSPRARCSATPTIAAVAAGVGRTPAQVVLRWHVQRGDIVFPKSVTPARMQENFEIFDFELDAADMAAITALEQERAHRARPGHLRLRPKLRSARTLGSSRSPTQWPTG